MKNNKVDLLKNRESYRVAKIEGEELKGFQKSKLKNNLDKEVQSQEAWRIICAILLLAFAFIAIYFMIYGG